MSSSSLERGTPLAPRKMGWEPEPLPRVCSCELPPIPKWNEMKKGVADMSLTLPCCGTTDLRMPSEAHGGPRLRCALWIVVVLVAIFLLHVLSPAGDSAWAADKAIYDVYYDTSPNDAAIRTPLLTDFGCLGVKWVRVNVNWGLLEPEQGTYDTREISRLDGLVDGLASSGVKVLMGVNCLPSWAQDTAYAGNPGRSYPIRSAALDDFGRLGEFLASHFAGRVRDIEVWNEPNLWASLYPQRTADDPYFAARIYLRMLKAFHAGVHRGSPTVRVVAGATAPIGLNDRLRTSPQRFARFLKDNGASCLLRRLLPPPVHSRRHSELRPGRTPERPLDDCDSLQSPHPAAPLPLQAVLPDRVRIPHGVQHLLRRLLCERSHTGALFAGSPTDWPIGTRR